jgi:hypothetical protein
LSNLKQTFLILKGEGAPSQVNKENVPKQKQKSKNKKGIFRQEYFSISMHFYKANLETLPQEHPVLPRLFVC